MAKLTRVTGKVFAGSAPLDEIGQFGSALSGTPVNTQDVATIQSLPAYTNGWGSAVVSSRNFPPIEEVNGVLKTISYQNCYLLQEGIPEYDINTEYSNTSVVKSINNGITTLYVSLANSNIGNALTDTTKWKPYVLDQIQRNIGEIVTSTIPLTDAGLHPLDGSKLYENGLYGGFYNYINTLYTATPTASYFCSEADWQTAVTNYGVCGKFVVSSDTDGNYVRLPKYNNKIYTSNISSTTPVVGNGMTIGITNGVSNSGLGWSSTTDRGILTGNDLYGTAVGTSFTSWSGGANKSIGLTTDAAKSGLVADLANITTSLDGYYYIVVATSTKIDIQVDIDEIATDLNGKLDKDGSNAATGLFESTVSIAQSTGKSTVTNWGMPDYTNGTNKTANTVYQTSSNICLWVRTNTNNVSGKIYIGSASDSVNTSIFQFSGNVGSHNSMHVYIPKGTYYNCSGNGFEGIVEYPLIGG